MVSYIGKRRLRICSGNGDDIKRTRGRATDRGGLNVTVDINDICIHHPAFVNNGVSARNGGCDKSIAPAIVFDGCIIRCTCFLIGNTCGNLTTSISKSLYVEHNINQEIPLRQSRKLDRSPRPIVKLSVGE